MRSVSNRLVSRPLTASLDHWDWMDDGFVTHYPIRICQYMAHLHFRQAGGPLTPFRGTDPYSMVQCPVSSTWPAGLIPSVTAYSPDVHSPLRHTPLTLLAASQTAGAFTQSPAMIAEVLADLKASECEHVDVTITRRHIRFRGRSRYSSSQVEVELHSQRQRQQQLNAGQRSGSGGGGSGGCVLAAELMLRADTEQGMSETFLVRHLLKMQKLCKEASDLLLQMVGTSPSKSCLSSICLPLDVMRGSSKYRQSWHTLYSQLCQQHHVAEQIYILMLRGGDRAMLPHLPCPRSP